MAVTYTKEQKQKLYAIALDALSMYDVDNSSLLKFVDRLSSGIVNEGGKEVIQVSFTKPAIEGIATAMSKLISKTEKTFKPSDAKDVRPYNRLLSFLDDTQNVIKSFKALNENNSAINKKSSNPISVFNSSLADTQGSSQVLDLIRSTTSKERVLQPTRNTLNNTPNSAPADTKGSTQEFDLIRDNENDKQIIDGFTENGKKDLKDALKGILQCVCDDKPLRSIPIQTQTSQPVQEESKKQQTGSGVIEKILLGAGLTYAVINALKNLFTKKPPVEVPKPAPKPPVEVSKPAPKPPVEVPKPAPKPPVEVPKPAPTKVPKLDEVVPKIKIPLSPEPKKPGEPSLPVKNKAPFKPVTATPKLEDVVPKIKVPSVVAKPIGKETVEAGTKYATKQGAKTLGKKIPMGVSAIIGTALAADRAYAGDWTGAGLEFASGVLGTFPGLGTATSYATDAALIARDANTTVTTAPTNNKDRELPSAVPQPLPPPKLLVEAPKPLVEAAKPKPLVEAPKPLVEAAKPKLLVETPKPKPLVEAAKPLVEAAKPLVEAPKPLVETPKPLVEAAKPKPLVETPKTKPLVEAAKQIVSPEAAAQIKKNVEEQVKKLNIDPKYLLASVIPKNLISSLLNKKERDVTNKSLANENLVTIAGFTKNGKKEFIDIITDSLSNPSSSSVPSFNKNNVLPTKALEVPSTFTDKLLNTLPENKFTKSLKKINTINKDPQAFKDSLKQKAQDTVLNKVQNIFKPSVNSKIPVNGSKNLFENIRGKGVDKSKDGVIKTATKVTGKSLAETTGKSLTKTAGKSVVKTAGKTAGKSLLKKIPGVGALAGLGFAVERLLSGDVSGAGLELASGIVGTVPGIGTAGSVGIDALLAAKDISTTSNTVEQVGDAAKSPSNIKPDGGLIVKSPKENSLFKPIQLSKNDGFIAAPFAKEGKIDTQGITKNDDKQLPVLQDLLKSSGNNNEQLNRLTDAIFKLAQAALNQPAASPTVIRQQIPVQTAQQHSTAQIASSNVDPIRAIRSRFGV